MKVVMVLAQGSGEPKHGRDEDEVKMTNEKGGQQHSGKASWPEQAAVCSSSLGMRSRTSPGQQLADTGVV